MPKCRVRIRTGSGHAPLAHAWVYWQEGSILTLVSDGQGQLFALDPLPSVTRDMWWEYLTPFESNLLNGQVRVYYSRGAKPLPVALLNAANFIASQVAVAPGAPPTPVTMAGNAGNALAIPPMATLDLAEFAVTLANPKELSFWPVLWEVPSDNDLVPATAAQDPAARPADYHTEGLSQGAALFTGNHVTTGISNTAAPAPTTKRPRERGMKVEGTITPAATGAKLSVLDANGTRLQLRTAAAATAATATEINCTVTGTTGFAADVFLADPVNAFGAVQIFLDVPGTPRVMDAFYVHLCGAQVALLDEGDPARNGGNRDQIGEAGEIQVIDYVRSPVSTAISDQVRDRRMLPFNIANAQRPLDSTQAANATTNPTVIKPQMPQWIAELQLVGTPQDQFKQLIVHRYNKENFGLIDPFTPLKWTLDLTWALTLSYDGPDANNGGYHYQETYGTSPSFSGPQHVEIFFGHRAGFQDEHAHDVAAPADGSAPTPFKPAPAAIPFPVANRRTPKVLVSGQTRPWGRQTGATAKPAVVVEFQPQLTIGGSEAVRGGDGRLELRALSIDGTPVPGGVLVTGAGGAPPAADPVARLPRFRVRGVNPAAADVNTLIDHLVRLRIAAGGLPAHTGQLTLAEWQETMRRIAFVESVQLHHYEHRGPINQPVPIGQTTFRSGHDPDMPICGLPHGYGYAQIDPPGGDENVWSYIANLKRGFEVLLTKANGANTRFTTGAGATAFGALPATTRAAMYRRDAVRGYNGGHEFQFEIRAPDTTKAWWLHPTVSFNPQYTNTVLGTHFPAGGPHPFP
ncbi:MAG TPA: hypothetical protein VG389_11430 [Myxococcota bacterium]|nr:hypothetical protein [Myxococcota bacterium]